MTVHTVEPPAAEVLKDLRGQLTCGVIGPGERGYESGRRVWNNHIDRRPSAIVKCESAEDVMATVRAARRCGLDFTTRGGGHNVAGNAAIDGGLVIDLGLLRQVRFDEGNGTVTVGAGCTWGEVDRPAADRRVVVPAGVVSHTGVAGLTLGGGTGYLSRKFGVTSDRLIAADFVTAEGELLRVTENQHGDLLWALRGAGHNFGIVTSFTFRCMPFETKAYIRQSFFPAKERKMVYRFIRQFQASMPDELTVYTHLLHAPPYWSQIPERFRGEPVMNVATIYYGPPAEGRKLTEPLHGIAEAAFSHDYQIPHVQLQHACDDDWRFGVNHYWKPAFIDDLPDEAIDIVLEWVDRYPGGYLQAWSKIAPQPVSHFELITRGGALRRVNAQTSSFSNRSAAFMSNIMAVWTDPDEEEELVAWARAFSDALWPLTSGAYVNFISEQGSQETARLIFGPALDRLLKVKAQYDPENVFHHGTVDLGPQDRVAV